MCSHFNVVFEQSIHVCEDCGEAIDGHHMSFEKEWRYYGMRDTRHSSDPSRCQARRLEERNIFKDVEKLGITDRILFVANQLYEKVAQGKVYRGSSRKGIIFACVFHAYKINGTPQSCEKLIQIFGLDKKIGLKGLKFLNLHVPKEALTCPQSSVSTETLILEIMTKFHATEVQKQEVLELYHIVQNKSMLLNRSRPHSVASGMVRYYIEKKGEHIQMDFFRSKVNISELTITKIVEEIKRILLLSVLQSPSPSLSASDSLGQEQELVEKEKDGQDHSLSLSQSIPMDGF